MLESLTFIHIRLGRPGVDCYCQHESGAAVLQLQFLINEVRISLTICHAHTAFIDVIFFLF